MGETVSVYLERFLQEQTLETFMLLRDAVLASPDYDPYNHYQSEAHALLEREEFAQVTEYLMSKIPGWILNPGIHKLLSFALHKLGDEERARMEFLLARAFLDGILLTGDGSEARPYLVSSVTDEYDVLDHLGKSLRQQSLVEKKGRRCDRFECEDGSQIWFDVSAPLARFESEIGRQDDDVACPQTS
jgi:hypothetical protein